MYLLTKYIKRVLWGVAVRLSYIQDARCLKDNKKKSYLNEVIPLCIHLFISLIYVAVITIIIEHNTNATCFDYTIFTL